MKVVFASMVSVQENGEEEGVNYQVGDNTLKRTKQMRYLGTYLTSSLSKGETICDGTLSAMKVMQAFLRLIEKHQSSWSLKENINNSVILPTVTYPIKSKATTKEITPWLRKNERNVILRLQSKGK